MSISLDFGPYPPKYAQCMWASTYLLHIRRFCRLYHLPYYHYSAKVRVCKLIPGIIGVRGSVTIDKDKVEGKFLMKLIFGAPAALEAKFEGKGKEFRKEGWDGILGDYCVCSPFACQFLSRKIGVV